MFSIGLTKVIFYFCLVMKKILGFIFSILCFNVYAQINWSQFQFLKQVEINDFISLENGRVYLATNGGVYISDDAGEDWTLINEGFEFSRKFLPRSNSVLELVETTYGIIARIDNGTLFLNENDSWRPILETYKCLDVEELNGEIYFIADTVKYTGYYSYSLFRMANIDAEPTEISYYERAFFGKDILSKAGENLVVISVDTIQLFDGTSFENIGNGEITPTRIIGKASDDLWAIDWTFFGPNSLFQLKNLYHYDGVQWEEVRQLETNNVFFGINMFYFEDVLHVYGIDQSTMTVHLYALEEVPVLGFVWKELKGFSEGVPPPVKGIAEASDIDYLYIGNNFIRHSITNLGFANEHRESNIFNGTVSNIALDDQNLFFIQNRQLNTINRESGEIEKSLEVADNNNFYNLHKINNDVVAIKNLSWEDSAVFYIKSAQNADWEVFEVNTIGQLYQINGYFEGGFGFNTFWEAKTGRVHQFEYNKSSNEIKEITLHPEDTMLIRKYYRENTTIVALLEPLFVRNNYAQRLDMKLGYSTDDGLSWTTVTPRYVKYDSLLSSEVDIFQKVDTIIVQRMTENISANTIAYQFLYFDKNTLELKEYSQSMPHRVKNIHLVDGVWYGTLNGIFSYSNNLTDWVSYGTNGMPEGATTLSYAFSDDEVWCSTDGNGIFYGMALKTGIDEPEVSKGFLLYPNPTHDYVTLESFSKFKKLEIIDLTGKLVRSYTFSVLQNSVKLDNLNLSSGIYLVTITDERNLKYTEKLIIK